MTVAQRLKELRRTRGIKQRDLADALDINVSAVGHWEAGSQKIPNYRLDQICTKYNVRREWLENGEGEMDTPEKDESENFLDVMMGMYRQLDDDNKKLWCALAGKIIEAGDDLEKATKACMETLANKSAVISNVGGDVTVNQ